MSTASAQNQFLATVSHEFRTPLSNIGGYTELLLDGDLGTIIPKQHRAIAIIDRNSHRLLSLTDDVLTFSRIDAGTLPLKPGIVNLNDLASNICHEVRTMAAEAGFTIHHHVPREIPRSAAMSLNVAPGVDRYRSTAWRRNSSE